MKRPEVEGEGGESWARLQIEMEWRSKTRDGDPNTAERESERCLRPGRLIDELKIVLGEPRRGRYEARIAVKIEDREIIV